jgi:hypothetical protein
LRIVTVTITHSRDQDGNKIVSIPVTNSDKPAILYLEDFNLLKSLGLDFQWRLNSNVVFSKGNLPVARLIANPADGEKVQYIDENRLNLKRSNLVVSKGQARSVNTRNQLANKPIPVRIGEREELNYVYIKPLWEQEPVDLLLEQANDEQQLIRNYN